MVDRVVPAHLACRIGARARAGERDAWPAVAAIALGSFALVFSEVIPVGLLADISVHLRVSIETGGLMVVVPAVFAVIAVAAQLAAVPRLGPGGRVRPGSLLTVITRPVSRAGLVAAGAMFFANFAAYTYIGPLLHTRAGLGAGAITLVLLGFGLAAVAAAAGSLFLLGRAGAAIGSPPAGPAELARERGRDAPAPPPGAIDTAGNSAQRPR